MKNRLAQWALAAAATLLSPLALAQVNHAVSFEQLVAASSDTSALQAATYTSMSSAQPGNAVQRVAGTSPMGFGSIMPASDRGISFAGDGSDRKWFATSAGPDPSVAWLMALGFLGLVIMRRTRSPLN